MLLCSYCCCYSCSCAFHDVIDVVVVSFVNNIVIANVADDIANVVDAVVYLLCLFLYIAIFVFHDVVINVVIKFAGVDVCGCC